MISQAAQPSVAEVTAMLDEFVAQRCTLPGGSELRGNESCDTVTPASIVEREGRDR